MRETLASLGEKVHRTRAFCLKDDQWTVQQRGAESAVGVFDTVIEAVTRATEVAENNANSQTELGLDSAREAALTVRHLPV